jgi:hypothetical protein
MRARFINEKFTEKSDPIKDMKIGPAARVKELQNKDYLKIEDFDDDIIIYLFKKIYDNWKKKTDSINPDNIEIWHDESGYGYNPTPTIKVSAPGVRQIIILKGDNNFYKLVSTDIIKLLKSPNIKKKLALKMIEMAPEKLAAIISTIAGTKQLTLYSGTVAHNIADRLIKILG